MATSSVFAQFKITDPQKAEALVAALEAPEREYKIKRELSATIILTITDLDVIRNLVAKRVGA